MLKQCLYSSAEGEDPKRMGILSQPQRRVWGLYRGIDWVKLPLSNGEILGSYADPQLGSASAESCGEITAVVGNVAMNAMAFVYCKVTLREALLGWTKTVRCALKVRLLQAAMGGLGFGVYIRVYWGVCGYWKTATLNPKP